MTVKNMNQEQKSIMMVYAIIIASMLVGFIPHAFAALAAIILFTAALVTAYSQRRRAAAGTLTRDHMRFIIRTIWASGGIGFFAIIAASIYILGNFDPAPVQGCADQMISFGDSAVVESCLKEFVDLNFNVFVIGTIIGAAPLVGYLLWRMGYGLSRLFKGQMAYTGPESSS